MPAMSYRTAERTAAMGRPLPIAVLWQRMTGYLDACLRSLAATNQVQLSVAFCAPANDAPYDETNFFAFRDQYRWHEKPNTEALGALLAGEALDAVLVCSWSVPAYRALLP